MYIVMLKQKEDAQCVWYKFEIDVENGNYVDKKGRICSNFEKKSGVFKFNKNNEFKSPYLDLIQFEVEPTDRLFLNNNEILAKCLVKMEACKKNNIYPDSLVYASCS